MALILFGVWSNQNIPASARVYRSIASDDCNSLVAEFIGPRLPQSLPAKDLAAEKVFKLKNSIWNKILSTSDFENFNDIEYFRWIEIYKDAKSDFSNVNPVSIEQKMALIEIINSRLIAMNPETIKKFTPDIEKLNTYKLRKLQTHMRDFNLSSKLTREKINDFAADLFIILKGPPVSLLDYFTMKKTARMNERMMRIVQEDMLVMGIKGMLSRVPEKESYTRIERAKYFVRKFFQAKAWKYAVIPYDLPWIERVKIPDELLENIMIDGLEAHDQELIAVLKKQNMVDHYERFRKVYKPVAFALGFYFYYDKFSDNMKGRMNENQEEEKRKFLEDFENLSNTINEDYDISHVTEDSIKEEQLKRVLKNFRDKNGNPTEDEYKEMRIKIFGQP